MKKRVCLAAAILLLGGAMELAAGTEINLGRLPPHPRLLLTEKSKEQLSQTAASEAGRQLAGKLVRNADAWLTEPLSGPAMIGNRLLYTARNLQCRIYDLGLAWHLTGDRQYADYAVKQMLAAADFPDWNDQVSFLDAAEMTAALAVGYDWFYPVMTPDQRDRIAAAIVDKGLQRSWSRKHGWIDTSGNWNSVCHAAMIAGALAVAEQEPALAKRTLERAVDSWRKTIEATYGPGGAYPEGPGYWQYGTDYLCFGLLLLRTAFETDFGLSDAAGLAQTGDYIAAMAGPSGRFFNYGDGSDRVEAMFAVFFLADRFNRPDYPSGAMASAFRRYIDTPSGGRRNTNGAERMMPLALLVPGFGAPAPLPKPANVYYSGRTAPVQVAVLHDESGWLGIKGGSPGVSHGHLDCGGFVFDFGGRRWASEIGNDNYERVEAAGRDLWNLRQDSDRWRLFRTGPASHSIVMLDEQIPNVTGCGVFLQVAPAVAELDLSSLYTPSASSVRREFRLLPEGGMSSRDRLAGLRPGTRVCWQLCTPAAVTVTDGGAMLELQGRRMRIESVPAGRWEVLPERHFKRDYYAGEVGISMLRGHFVAPVDGKLELMVRLIPASGAD